MKTIDDYNSLIRLLSDILKFYANKDNYVSGLIKADGGFQAKFALDKIEGFNEMEENILKEINDHPEFGMDEQDSIEVLEILKNLKNLNNLNSMNNDSV